MTRANAREDTATPVKISVACMIANLALNILLMGPLKHVGIALATSLSAWLNVALLAGVLARRGQWVPDARLKARVLRQAGAAAAMAVVLVLLLPRLAHLFADGEVSRVAALFILVAVGLLAYALAAWGLGAASPAELRTALARTKT